jgi:hypothetical protein
LHKVYVKTKDVADVRLAYELARKETEKHKKEIAEAMVAFDEYRRISKEIRDGEIQRRQTGNDMFAGGNYDT